MSCRINRATEWAVRCLHERAQWKRSVFATLTYDDADLPADYGLDKDEFTKFWKRLRKLAERKLRYYACGEYGEEKGRPHYHAIIFGVAPWERELLAKAWGHGMVYTGTVTMQSARYTADYVGKAVTGERGAAFYGERQPPFAVMSLGIGRVFVDGNRDLLLRSGLTVNGHHVALPRYYRTRLGVGKEIQVLPDCFVTEGESEETIERRSAHQLDSKEQQAANIAAKTSLRKKGSL